MQRLIMVVMMAVMLMGAVLSPAEAALRAPLRGAALRTSLAPEQYQRAMYFLSLKGHYLASRSEDANAAIDRVETIHAIAQTILDIAGTIDTTKDFSETSVKYGAKLATFAKSSHVLAEGISPKIKSYIRTKGATDSLELILATTGYLLELTSEKFPALTNDSAFQQYQTAVENADPTAIVSGMNQLLDHPDPLVNFLSNAAFSVAVNILTLVPDLPEIATEYRRVKFLGKYGGSFTKGFKTALNAQKTLSKSAMVLPALGMMNDLASAAVLADIDASLKTDLIAMEFLDYYLVTYGGDLAAFQADMGLLTANPTIAQTFFVFFNQKTSLGQVLKEQYGPVNWLDRLFDNYFDATRAGDLIRRVLTTAGPLALRLGYTDNQAELLAGYNTGYQITLEPLLAHEGFSLTGATFSQTGGATETIYNYGIFTPNSATPGTKNFSVSYTLSKNSVPTTTSFTFTDDVRIALDAVQMPPLAYKELAVSGNLNEFSLTATIQVLPFTLPYGGGYTGIQAGTLPLDATSKASVRLSYTTTSGEAHTTAWQELPLVPGDGATFTLPVTSPAALATRSGEVGNYRVELQLSNPFVSGLFTDSITWSLSYADLLANGTGAAVPYLEIQAPDEVWMSGQISAPDGAQWMQLIPSYKIRLYPKNDPLYPSFSALQGVISVWLIDRENTSYVVTGTLLADGGIEFSITPDMPAGMYQVITVAADNNGIKTLLPRYLAQQVKPLIPPAIGGDDPPPSTTGSVVLPRTGQYKSYAAGDDGAIQAGKTWPIPRFTDNSNGTITDNLTGLIWLKDANCFGTKTWNDALAAANTLASGACGLTDGSSAGQWRLPNIVELESLVDAKHNPYLSVLPDGHPFSNVQRDSYWSSSTAAAYPQNAWHMDLGVGRLFDVNGYKYDNKNVWVVRGN